MKIPIKYHIENNKVIYDEEINMKAGDFLFQEEILHEDGHLELVGVYIWRNDDDDVEYCDCGKLFNESGYCRFCGAHARYGK